MKKLLNFTYITLLLLLITACSNTGIFYTLENVEKNVDNNNLNNSANFSNLVYTGNDYLGNAGPNIYYRSDSPDTTLDNWAALALPDPNDTTVSFASDGTVSSMVLDDSGDLYISRISHDGSNIISGIYRLPNADLLTPSTVISADWEMIVETVTAKAATTFTYSVYKLHKAFTSMYINHLTYDLDDTNDVTPALSNSLLYVSTTPSSISNDLSTSGFVDTIDMTTLFVIDTETKDENGDPINEPIKVEIQKIISFDGTNYWIILNGTSTSKIAEAARNTKILLSTIDNKTFSDVATDIPDSDDPNATRLIDIFEYSATEILVSNTKGSIYISTNTGATWTESTVKSGAFFNGFANINGLTPDTANTVIVGTAANIGSSTTNGSGYYEIDMSLATIDWADTDFSDAFNYSSTGLSDASINGFLYDSTDTNSRLFAYTRAHGVWMNVDNAGSREWDQE